MKNLLKSSFILLAVASMTFLASCGEEDVEEPIDAPTLSVTSAASTYALDEVISFTVTYTTPGQFGGFNYSFTATDGETPVEFTKQLLGPTDLVDEGVDGTATSGSFTFKPFGDVAIQDLEFTVNDEDYSLAGKNVEFDFEILNASVDGLSATASATFSVEEVGIVVHTQTLLGGPQNATLGSFYDAVVDSVYSASNAFAVESQANIDLVFWFGTSSQYAIGATDDEMAETAFKSQADIDLANLATRNSTKFEYIDGTAEIAASFDAVATESDLLAIAGDGTSITESRVTILDADAVFAFRLDTDRGSKIGLAKVVEVSGNSGATRSITIQVKIQE